MGKYLLTTVSLFFENIFILLVKCHFLSHEDHLNILKASTTVSNLWTHMVKFKSLDFSPLQDVNLSYVSQTSIPTDKTDIFLACDIHYNFNLPSIIRYIGGNYTTAHQDIEDIVDTLPSAGYNELLVNEIKRIMLV